MGLGTGQFVISYTLMALRTLVLFWDWNVDHTCSISISILSWIDIGLHACKLYHVDGLTRDLP